MKLEKFIGMLDEATADGSTYEICKRVESALENAVQEGLELPDSCREPSAKCYARHLVYLAPEERYSVVAMVWGDGQGTPLHDHANTWCVECVIDGQIEVTTYEALGKDEVGNTLFRQAEHLIAGFGEAGHLIPPLEYHTLCNALEDKTSMTLHVYGGNYDECSIFLPTEKEGAYRRETRQMTFTSVSE